MITAVIRTRNGIEALAATLSSLVPGVVEGLVADAVVVGAADEATRRVAEAAGATCLAVPAGRDPWSSGAGLARRDWLLCLEAGDMPRDGWVTAMDRFLTGAGRDARLARLDRAPLPAGERVLRWRDQALGAAGPRPGDLVRRELLGAVWPRGLRPQPLRASLERLPA